MNPITVRKNVFYTRKIDGVTYYCIKHKTSGQCAIFEHEPELLKELIDIIEKHGTIKPYEGYLYLRDPTISLAAYLYGLYRQLPAHYVMSKTIKHIHNYHIKDGLEDCRYNNLAATDESIPDNRQRRITHNGNTIQIYLKSTGTTDYADYTPDLYEILTRPDICSFEADKNRRIKVHIANRRKASLASIVYAYNKLQPEPDDFVEQYITFADQLKAENKCVDHANSDFHNHCKWNLSAISTEENTSKAEKTARIKPPYFLHIAVTDGEQYRVMFGYNPGEYGTGKCMYVQCPTVQDLKHFMNAILRLQSPNQFFNKRWIKDNLPADLWRAGKKAMPETHRFNRAYNRAMRLLSLENDKFTIWTKDSQFPE